MPNLNNRVLSFNLDRTHVDSGMKAFRIHADALGVKLISNIDNLDEIPNELSRRHGIATY